MKFKPLKFIVAAILMGFVISAYEMASAATPIPNTIKRIGAKSAPADTLNDDSYYGTLLSNDIRPSATVRKHFTWGLEIGSSVDVTGYDLTTFNADICLGYRNSIIRTAGLGLGVHRAFGNGNAFVPIYFVLRTALRQAPSRLFVDFRAGYSFNTLSHESYKGGFQMSAGFGYTLTQSKKVSTYVAGAYGYYHINATHTTNLNMDTSHADFAIFSFGATF